MSDNWIALVPVTPDFVPSEAQQRRASERFLELAPETEEIEVIVSDTVRFFDCGSNLETIRCPSCGADLPMQTWQTWMEADEGQEGFRLASREMPCCHSLQPLNELIYDWPQAFGRFAVDAMNPGIGTLGADSVAEFETILGTRLRVVYQHI